MRSDQVLWHMTSRAAHDFTDRESVSKAAACA
jgi:hypothetical protein